ncbi:MAG: hypothetical protein AAFX93_01705 [Verrucomicrobiota bacterium]
MAESSDQQSPRKDFISGLILSLFSVYVLIQGAQYPLTGAYGGVDNAWYVSPALMPLFIGLVLLILSLFLMGKAGAALGWSAIGKVDFWTVKRFTETQWSVVQIIALLAAYVLCLIPNVDFLVASWLFLICLSFRFFVPEAGAVGKLMFWLIGGASLWALAINVVGAFDEESRRVLAADTLVLPILAFGWAQVWIYLQGQGLQRQRRQLLWATVLIPFIVVLIFKFLLLVPMPAEGSILLIIDWIYFGIRHG